MRRRQRGAAHQPRAASRRDRDGRGRGEGRVDCWVPAVGEPARSGEWWQIRAQGSLVHVLGWAFGEYLVGKKL